MLLMTNILVLPCRTRSSPRKMFRIPKLVMTSVEPQVGIHQRPTGQQLSSQRWRLCPTGSSRSRRAALLPNPRRRWIRMVLSSSQRASPSSLRVTCLGSTGTSSRQQTKSQKRIYDACLNLRDVGANMPALMKPGIVFRSSELLR